MIVVDANVLAYFHLDTDFSDLAAQAFRIDPHWIAPPLWQSEFENILAGYLRRNHLQLPGAKLLMDNASRMMEEAVFPVSPHRVLELVTKSSCTSYDCEYVALAEQFEVKLLTQDKRVLSDFSDIAIKLENFVKTS